MAPHEGKIIIGPFGENSRAFFCIFTYDSSLVVFSQLSYLYKNVTNTTCTLSFLCRAMISLSEVTYSQDTRVAAVRDYIFLTQTYLDGKTHQGTIQRRLTIYYSREHAWPGKDGSSHIATSPSSCPVVCLPTGKLDKAPGTSNFAYILSRTRLFVTKFRGNVFAGMARVTGEWHIVWQ